MQTKRRTTVYIDATLIEQAKELGINISKTLELALKREIAVKKHLYSLDNSSMHNDSVSADDETSAC